MASVAHEHDHWEGVANDELSDTSQQKQERAKGERCTDRSLDGAHLACAPPAHQLSGQRCETNGEPHDGQRSWVGESLAQVSSYIGAWRQEETLELLVGDGVVGHHLTEMVDTAVRLHRLQVIVAAIFKVLRVRHDELILPLRCLSRVAGVEQGFRSS